MSTMPGWRSWTLGLTGGLEEWNFHLGIAAGCCGVHGGDNAVNVAMNGGALRIAEDNDRDTAAFEVLLVTDILVRR